MSKIAIDCTTRFEHFYEHAKRKKRACGGRRAVLALKSKGKLCCLHRIFNSHSPSHDQKLSTSDESSSYLVSIGGQELKGPSTGAADSVTISALTTLFLSFISLEE